MSREARGRLDREIQSVIDQWEGTIFGYELKNMRDNGTDYETLCEKAGLLYEDFADD